MNFLLESLEEEISEYRNQLLNHPVYHSLRTIEDLRVFMEHHAFAVWDFMSLLKWLQSHYTRAHSPWIPVSSGDIRFMINEMVLGEESDEHPNGGRISHYELYLEAMMQAGANTSAISELVTQIGKGMSVKDALLFSRCPTAAQKFVGQTFKFIDSGKSHVIASAFTFGREDLIPDMFTHFVESLPEKQSGQLEIFDYYLKRHIELDGDHHSHLAKKMIGELCGSNPERWREATTAAIDSLNARIALWDGVMMNLQSV
jgi:Protein of unknown function (DUF3050)